MRQIVRPLPPNNSTRNCPSCLFAPLIKIIIEEIRKLCKEDPLAFGFNPQERAYEPLKLMQAVMAKTNEVCLRYQDNSVLCSLPQPQNTCFVVSAHAMRNRRKKMEDRHVIIHDLSMMFDIQEASPSSYYAVFDGHAGHDAAAYSAAHLHQYLAENKHFATDPKQALLDAFCKTDALFLEKCKVENFSSGTTAVVALLRPKDRTLYIAWAGDSLALLVNQGRILQCVNPHKPCRADERERIHEVGGACMRWAGVWRVSGQLAVSRAIGDAPYKPSVTAVPDIKEIALDGGEDFLILACDGLWDYISEDAAAQEVYYLLAENSDDTERISKHLSQLARYQGSTDNISVIVVFLREPSKIAADAPRWATRPANKMDVEMDQHTGQLDNQFANSNGAPNDILLQKQQNEHLLLNLVDNINKSNGTDFNGSILDPTKSPSSNGTHKEFHHDDFHHDDFGPETDVDAVDDVNNASVVSPVDKTKSFQDALLGNSALENAKAIHEAILGNNNPFEAQYNPFLQDHEKAQLETEENIQGLDRQQSQESEDGRRDETPTPPIETVQESAEVEEINQDSDSEDEWNFIKGDEAKKGTGASQPETVVECAEEDAMSQLNPNAAEFVPVSPTRSIPSPACRALINDEVIAQSPKRPVQIDLNLPNENDFESEVKSRPSEDVMNNGHHSDSDPDTPSKDPMEFLNGTPTPTKSQPNEEFHFGPNAAPYTPKLLDQSEAASSTRAVFGDESTATLDMTQFSESQEVNKENADPMSMSFSAERGDVNPFSNFEDLNKVHVLPENLEEFLDNPEENKENILDFTISDLPEHHPIRRQVNNNDAIKTTDLDQEDEKELASPLEPELQQELEERSRTPQPTQENLLGDIEEEKRRDQTPDLLEGESKIEAEVITNEEMTMDLIHTQAQVHENKEILTPTDHVAEGSFAARELRSEDACAFPSNKEILSSQLETEFEGPLVEKEVAPVSELSSHLQTEFEEPLICPLRPEEAPVCELPSKNSEDELVCPIRPQRLHENEESLPPYQANDVFNSEPVAKSPDFELLEDKSPINDSPSPACEFRAPSSELLAPVQEDKLFAESPVQQEENIEVLQEQKSLTEEVTSSVKDDVSSPVSPVISPENDEPSRNLVVVESTSEMILQQATEVPDLLATQPEPCNLPTSTQPEVCPIPTNISFNAEPLIPNDQINTFLDQAQNQFINQMQEISDQIHIKTDTIVPEFAQQEVITPSEDSNGIDIEANEPPAVALVEPPVQEILSPLVQETLKVKEVPKVETEKPKEKEAKKSPAKKSLGTKAPTPKAAAAAKAPTPKGAAPARPSGVSPRVPARTGTATKTATPKPAAPVAASRTTAAAPKPKAPTAAKPAASKPLMNGDVKTSVAAKKPGESTLSKTSARPTTLTKTSPTPRAAASRTTTAPKAPSATPRTAPGTARPTSGVTKTASTTAPKPKTAVSTTRTVTSTTKTASGTLTTRVSSTTVSKTTSTSKPATAAPPKPKTITNARVPLTKTITKNAELEKQNKESANKLTASKSSTLTSTRTTNMAGTKTSSSTVKKTDAKPLSSRTTVSKTSTTTTKSTLGKKPAEVKSTTKTKTTKVEKPKENGISATIVTEEIMVNNVVNETVNNIVNTDDLVNNVSENDNNLLKDNSPIDNKLIDSLIEVNGAD